MTGNTDGLGGGFVVVPSGTHQDLSPKAKSMETQMCIEGDSLLCHPELLGMGWELIGMP